MGEQYMSVDLGYTQMPAGYIPHKPKKYLGTVAGAKAELDAKDTYKFKSKDGTMTVYQQKKPIFNGLHLEHPIIGRITSTKMKNGVTATVIHRKYSINPQKTSLCSDIDGDGKFDTCERYNSNSGSVIINEYGEYHFPNKRLEDVYKQCLQDPMLSLTIRDNLLSNRQDKRADAFKVE